MAEVEDSEGKWMEEGEEWIVIDDSVVVAVEEPIVDELTGLVRVTSQAGAGACESGLPASASTSPVSFPNNLLFLADI